MPPPTAEQPRLAILFWYYKDSAVCLNRLRALRHYNTGVPIFGLYGGDPADFARFDAQLGPLLNDHWAFEAERPALWKWKYGDKLISAWFRARGHQLDWDTVLIAQWDFLVRAPFSRLAALRKDVLYLPGLRPLAQVEDSWCWLKPGSDDLAEYQRLRHRLAQDCGFTGPVEACNFVSGALPRRFLQQYAALDDEADGFLEYKLPMYARAWHYDVQDLPALRLSWYDQTARHRRVTMSADLQYIPLWVILLEWLLPSGARFFHPVRREIADTRLGLALQLLRRVLVRRA